MRKPLAAAISLLAVLTSAKSQTSDTPNKVQTAHAVPGTVSTASPQPASQPRGSTHSRACLTAQTLALLAQLEGQFGSVKVISTCRPGAVIAGSGRPSQHRYGKAVDFVPSPGQRASVIAWLRQNSTGAVITYRSGHVHFDTGPWRVYSCGDCGKRSVRRLSASASIAAKPNEVIAAQSIPH